jgi:hypothetical protein
MVRRTVLLHPTLDLLEDRPVDALSLQLAAGAAPPRVQLLAGVLRVPAHVEVQRDEGPGVVVEGSDLVEAHDEVVPVPIPRHTGAPGRVLASGR